MAMPMESGGKVEVRVRELDQLFDSLDPSPFYEKDLDRNAEEYIVASVKELPAGTPTALVVHLDQPAGAADEARLLGDAIRVHFARRSQLLRWELRRLLRRGWISLCIGLAVLAASVIGGEALTQSAGGRHLPRVFAAGLHIGGWVAMWHPIEIFLYQWWPLLGERRIYDRLSQMPVEIAYNAPAAPGVTPALRSAVLQRSSTLEPAPASQAGGVPIART